MRHMQTRDKMNRTSGVWLFVAAFALAAVSPVGFPQAYPTKPVHIVVPYAPGGAIDLTARLYQQRLSIALGQPVVVDNRPGAAGKVGAEVVSRAEPDGYTVLYTVGGELTIWQSKPGTPDSIKNLTPITSAVASVGCIAARADLPVNSMAELIEYVKRNPGKLTYGSSGIGSFQHLMGERLKQHGIDLVHVPFKGLGPVMAAIVAGQIDLAITNLSTGLPPSRQGRIKILALTQSNRFEATPDIPTVSESLPGFDMPVPWYGFFGPPNLPQPIVARLGSEIAKVLEAPEVKSKLTSASLTAIIATPEQFSALVRKTGDTFQKIIKAANIQLD